MLTIQLNSMHGFQMYIPPRSQRLNPPCAYYANVSKGRTSDGNKNIGYRKCSQVLFGTTMAPSKLSLLEMTLKPMGCASE